MKRIILTTNILCFSVVGLFAQNTKAGNKATEAKTTPTILTHKDSIYIQKLIKEAQTQSDFNNTTQTIPDLHDQRPTIPGNRGTHPFTDVIDVEHQIK